MGDVEIVTESGSTDILASAAWEALATSSGTVFHTPAFLLSWWRDRLAKSPTSELITVKVVEDESVLGICAFELASGVLSFAGGRDVVDYMGPAAVAGREKDVAAALTSWMFDDAASWTHIDLAGLANDDPAAEALIDEISRTSPDASIEPHDQAPRIEPAPQGYLACLNSKRRADVLRKRNRLTEACGELELVDSPAATVLEPLERLLAWKAAASEETRAFVDEYGAFVRGMVTDLSATDAAHVVELRAAGRPLASIITLRHRDTVHIYNMSYDAELAALAPGVVLISLLIERSLDQGLQFDFLKGAQDYKLRLGGVPVDLIGIRTAR